MGGVNRPLGVMPVSFTEPLSITIAPASAASLPRTDVAGDRSQYTSNDGLVMVTADHDKNQGREKRTRRVLRIDHSKLSANPNIPAENVRVSMSHYIVFDIPPAGYSVTEQLAIYTGFKAMYTATSDALITKLLGGES